MRTAIVLIFIAVGMVAGGGLIPFVEWCGGKSLEEIFTRGRTLRDLVAFAPILLMLGAVMGGIGGFLIIDLLPKKDKP